MINKTNKSISSFFHLLHVDDHEGGDAGGEDEEHDDDVDHGVALHGLLVVVPDAAAADQLPGPGLAPP